MIFRVGVENNNEGRSIAWALEHPGCFAYGTNGESAAAFLETAIQAYATWVLRRGPNTWLNFEEIEIVIEETFEDYLVNDEFDRVNTDGYAVESFFRHDWKPLQTDEISRALKLLSWNRADLLKTIEGLSPTKLDATYFGERWSINGILGHIGGAEWWYMERLGLAFPESEVPKEPLARLEKVRSHFLAVLPQLRDIKQVIGLEGELWSPRKILRRAMWHERDHIDHIQKLLKNGN